MSEENLSNAFAFLEVFNEIEAYCKRITVWDKRETFMSMLAQLSREDKKIKRFRNDLLEFAELRNAIVHNYGDNKVIAVPTNVAVEGLKAIRDEIIKAPTVKSKFGKKVITLQHDDKILNLLHTCFSNGIDQIPIMDNKKVIEIINGNTIARWLGANEIVAPEDNLISELFEFIEHKKNFAFLHENCDVYTCAEEFMSRLNFGWYYDAILLSNSGSNGEGLTGIVVLEDIAPYLTA